MAFVIGDYPDGMRVGVVPGLGWALWCPPA